MKINSYLTRSLILTLIFTGVLGSALYAKPVGGDEKGKALSNEDKAKRKKEVISMLSGTTWDVELFSMSDPKKKPIKDVVSYEHSKLNSKFFSAEGYGDSNLTVTIEDDGKAIWETMQSHASKGPVFWRGELSDKAVNGVVSRQGKDGSTEAFSLRGVQSGTFEVAPEKPATIIEAPKEVPAAVVPETPAPAAVPAETAAAMMAKPVVPVAEAKAKPVEVAVAAKVKSVPPVVTKVKAKVKPVVAAPVKVKKAPPVVEVPVVKTEAKPAAAEVVQSVKTAANADATDADKKKWFW